MKRWNDGAKRDRQTRSGFSLYEASCIACFVYPPSWMYLISKLMHIDCGAIGFSCRVRWLPWWDARHTPKCSMLALTGVFARRIHCNTTSCFFFFARLPIVWKCGPYFWEQSLSAVILFGPLARALLGSLRFSSKLITPARDRISRYVRLHPSILQPQP